VNSKLFSIILVCVLFSSCSLFGKKGKWGKNAFWPIKSNRVANAFKKNASSLHVLLPLAGAGVSYFGKFDEKISRWAVEKKYVYGDQESTSTWSNKLNKILLYEMYLSILLTPSMDEDKSLWNYALSKGKGAFLVNMASRATHYTRDELAMFFKRERPNKLNNLSFPSGHSTEAGARNSLVRKNIESVDMSNSFRTGINTINTTMAAGTLWARLEGQRHYPSDVLVGYALGSFVSGVIYDSLMNLEENETFSVNPSSESVSVNYGIRF
jgi:hypothetical protein